MTAKSPKAKASKPRAAAPNAAKSKSSAITETAKTAETGVAAVRNSKGHWLKGAPSPNPGGHPRGMGEVKKLARAYTKEAVETLAAIMQDKRAASSSRVSAATALLDRGYGKPVQQLEVGRPGDFSDMAEHEVDAFIARASQDLAHLCAADSSVMH